MCSATKIVGLFLLVAPVPAQVVGIDIEQRGVVAEGREFGDVGTYERIEGRLRLALDPDDPRNRRIVDLEIAPRNVEGLVEATADVVVLQPTNPTVRGTALIEVCNRGGRASLSYFNGGRSRDLSRADAFGDGLLMRLGLTVVWIGWQFDVPLGGDRLRLSVPRVEHDAAGQEILGRVRADWVVDRPERSLALGHRNHVPYRPRDPDRDAHVLTRRAGRDAEREIVPREAWRFAENGQAIAPTEGSFEPPWIYELVYESTAPAVVGIGLAAVRDVASYAKYDPECPFGVKRSIAIGISQTGRFLRHFLWQGFDTDTSGRPSYDGVLALTAGAGRGSFNHRFAQPSRDAHRYSAFVYPTDIFPFTTRLQQDPVTGRLDGLFARQHDPDHLPKVFWINTGYEYWGRAAALIHTSVDGERDVEPTARERIYHVSSAQHYPGSIRRGNPIDLRSTYRALLVAMVEWVRDEREPPPSRYPRIADGTLVPLARLATPSIPDVDWPAAAHTAYRADYGPRFWSDGVVSNQPPVLGPDFPTLVPQVDELGNEIAGIRGLELRAPVGTFLPHSLRADGEMMDFVGRWVPLPANEGARRTGDSRPILEALWGDAEGPAWRAAVEAAARELVEERFLLGEDVEPATGRASALRAAAMR